ncbi:MAG: F0F1 ATP synthase subunit beta, partial [Patescibacteria group bacterium]|nr:F0F1 ATP synthase subunit beta [Patescibacteria group bacterium]
MNQGKIIQIIGAVVDVEFPDQLPALYNAITTKTANEKELVLETVQHLGANRVRAVSMGSTDGLQRGVEAEDTGSPISVPVGEEV